MMIYKLMKIIIKTINNLNNNLVNFFKFIFLNINKIIYIIISIFISNNMFQIKLILIAIYI